MLPCAAPRHIAQMTEISPGWPGGIRKGPAGPEWDRRTFSPAVARPCADRGSETDV